MDAYRSPEDVALLDDAAKRAVRYLTTLDVRPVAPAADAVAAVTRLAEPLPGAPSAPAETLALLDEIGSPATMGMAGGRFFGFVIGGSYPVSVAASWLATAWDQNTGLWEVTPAVSQLEDVALDWMVELLGLPPGTGGAFVTGATLANFTALAAARHAVLARAGWDVEGEGLFGAPPITVIVGDEVHPSVVKALGLLGLGRRRVVRVPADGRGRMRADLLPRIAGPTIVCLQAGNVNTGDCDPIADVCDVARPAGAWVHVDGAFGLWAAASPALAPLVAGIGEADSWATDAHKWLNVPYDSGLAFVADAAAHRAAMAIPAAYKVDVDGGRDQFEWGPEWSRRARGFTVYAALRALGRRGVAALVDRCCDMATRLVQRLGALPGVEVLAPPIVNQALVRFLDGPRDGGGDHDARTQAVVERIQRGGGAWFGPTTWRGMRVMRISVSNFRTDAAAVDRVVDAVAQALRS